MGRGVEKREKGSWFLVFGFWTQGLGLTIAGDDLVVHTAFRNTQC